MRVASSPTLRIAAGLLLAVLLSIVGYRVLRRWVSHGPEALLERADEMSWLNSAVRTKSFYSTTQRKLHQLPVASQTMAASEPFHISIRSSIPIASRDSIVDLLLAPDPYSHESTLGRGPVHPLY